MANCYCSRFNSVFDYIFFSFCFYMYLFSLCCGYVKKFCLLTFLYVQSKKENSFFVYEIIINVWFQMGVQGVIVYMSMLCLFLVRKWCISLCLKLTRIIQTAFSAFRFDKIYSSLDVINDQIVSYVLTV
jgi:hypothetical protein